MVVGNVEKRLREERLVEYKVRRRKGSRPARQIGVGENGGEKQG